MRSQTLPWVHPLEAAAALTQGESCWVLLHSGQGFRHTGRYSYLALQPQEIVSGHDFAALAGKPGNGQHPMDNAWFGFLGYELLHGLETLTQEARNYIDLPGLWFARFGIILRFDYSVQNVTCFHAPDIAPPVWPPARLSPPALPQVTSLTSPMPKAAYLELIAKTREAITRGDFYQANITRKFTGEFAAPGNALALFERLCAASPAAYSAALKFGDTAILSSSPERFLKIEADGHMESRPIKGTAPLETDPATLSASVKDRAENLMIVDLMRNDLARACEPGSVKVERLFEVTTYATLHHMDSTITGQKRGDVSTLDAVKACFPPGSMTGAPKIRAMEWCLKHEGIRRGVYSGALGWFGGDGSCDFNVVIRTLVIKGTRFEFQVGGGIVADSEPEAEWRETMTKAQGIVNALNINNKAIESL